MTNIQFMQYAIIYKPAYTLLEVKPEERELIEAEPGAMVYMSPGIDIVTRTQS